MNKLPPVIKMLWLEALRSGEFQQGQMLLHPGENRHCCIGVLDIVFLGYPAPRACGDPSAYEFLDKMFGDDVTTHLWDMNDVHEKSFSEIADWIEENL